VLSELSASALMGTGQFCTNPGIVVLLRGNETNDFISAAAEKYKQSPIGTLLSAGVEQSLAKSIAALQSAGAQVAAGGSTGGGRGYCHANTLLVVNGEQFLAQPAALQTEAFGNSSLFVVADDVSQAVLILDALEGNLTGCIYSDREGNDDDAYAKLVGHLRPKVGRLLNDKMPTGVAVSPAMNHGGPYPATGHPGFTAVGIPASLRRFAMLQCFDNVREPRLPAELRNRNPSDRLWRLIDGAWTTASL
jgi:NADP-dependent aldehyde dehydrogenase